MNHVTILAIETATSVCSVALHCGGKRFERMEIGSNIHSKVLLTMVESILTEAMVKVAQLDAVAVSSGPGSFTGLRIGIGVAQGLAYGSGCPMIAISSLDALAAKANAGNAEVIVAGIDARMGQIYWCAYSNANSSLQRVCELQVSDPAAVLIESSKVVLVGNAWAEYWPHLNPELTEKAEHRTKINHPLASSILDLSFDKFDQKDWVSPADFLPEYVRNDVAKKSRKSVLKRR